MSRSKVARFAPIAAGLAAWHCIGGATAAAADAIPTYRASYAVEYKGRNLGTSEFSMDYDAERERYVFSSRTTAKGLAKLLSPNPVVEHSEFEVVDGAIRPIVFRYEDGSRKGEDNFEIAFDWQSGTAVATGADGTRELTLTAGVLDRGSLQAALMRDLALAGAPASYMLADDEGLKPYSYADNGAHTIETGVGPLATHSFVQSREGSSRTTWLWFAAELAHLPVRIEQRRDGEVQTALTLQSVTGFE